MGKIVVIDSMCGRGKTQWALQNINAHPNEAVIYASPLLSELGRVIQGTCNGIIQPDYHGGHSKFYDFNRLIEDGESIAVSHSTFTKSTNETANNIHQGKYTLYLDETMDVLVPYQDVADKKLKRGDIDALKDAFIEVDEAGCVSWKSKSYVNDGFEYGEIERLAKLGCLLFLGDTLFVWEFPISVFNAFEQVYVMSYMFDGSILKAYLDYHGLEYTKMQVERSGAEYSLVPYTHDDADVQTFQTLISRYTPPAKAKRYTSTNLSSTWYKNNIKGRSCASATTLRTSTINNYLRNVCKAKAKQIMWCCPKDYKSKIEEDGWKFTRRLTKEERDLPKVEQEKLKQQISCFVSSNARGTNEYADRDVLVYACNLYPNPYIQKFFAEHGVHLDADAFALSALIQWVWRSAIRKIEPQPIQLYIVSRRVSDLFEQWLNGQTILPERSEPYAG